MTCIRGGSAPFITILHWELHREPKLYSLIYERPLTMAMFDINDVFLNCVSQAPEDPSAKPQVKANLGTLMGVYLPTIQVEFFWTLSLVDPEHLERFMMFTYFNPEHLRCDPVHSYDMDCWDLWVARRIPLCLCLLGHSE